jgi:hypothetical protein
MIVRACKLKTGTEKIAPLILSKIGGNIAVFFGGVVFWRGFEVGLGLGSFLGVKQSS